MSKEKSLVEFSIISRSSWTCALCRSVVTKIYIPPFKWINIVLNITKIEWQVPHIYTSNTLSSYTRSCQDITLGTDCITYNLGYLSLIFSCRSFLKVQVVSGGLVLPCAPCFLKFYNCWKTLPLYFAGYFVKVFVI